MEANNEQTHEVIFNTGSECRFRHASGAVYHGKLGGCGEAMHVLDANRREITVIPTKNERYILDADISLAIHAVTAIAVSEGIAKLREQAATKEHGEQEALEIQARELVSAGGQHA